VNLATIIERHPDAAVALAHAGREHTYGELRAAAGAMRRHLAENGIGSGDRVALLLPTSPAFVVAYFGSLGSGAIAVPLNPESPLAELEAELAKVKPAVVLVGGERRDELQAALAAAGHSVWRLTTHGRREAGWTALAPEGRQGPDTERPEPAIVDREPEDTAVLLFTSGTAGAPKAAMLTHGSLLANIEQMELSVGLAVNADDVGVLVVPPFHIFGLNAVLGVQMSAGGKLVLVERFEPAAMLELMSSEKVTILVAVPQLFAALAAVPATGGGARPELGSATEVDAERPSHVGAGDELESVRLACSGAAPLSLDTAQAFKARFGVPIWQGYGLTEASPTVTFPDLAAPHRPASVGLVLPGVELRIVDVDGHDVEPGDPGEILVRGPNLFAGYLDDDAATARAIDRGGWLHTGDVAVMDEDGSLTIVDRRKDIVIVSGFNVFPAEVEKVLEAHPGVAEAAVVGIPDAAHGEAVRAFVVPVPGSWPDGAEAPDHLSEAELVTHSAHLLAKYKCPTSVTFVRQLPHGLQGKVVRRAVH
jgi:long-chain acyl-CoA synthetase